jgi:flagellar hook assembly protein FlgD
VRVFDATGAYVATLYDGERKPGAYSVEWNGLAADGSTVGSGVYFARIEQGGATKTMKMVLLK